MIEIRAAIAYDGLGVNVKEAWGDVSLMKEMIGVLKEYIHFPELKKIIQFLNLIYLRWKGNKYLKNVPGSQIDPYA